MAEDDDMTHIGWAWRHTDLDDPWHSGQWFFVGGTERPTFPARGDLSNGYHSQLVEVYARVPNDATTPDRLRDLRPLPLDDLEVRE